MPAGKRGFFLTLEGPEGSGKTTQARGLAERLQAAGERVLATREPGGTPIGDRIRQILLDPAARGMSDRCEFLLYAASRAQHYDEKIAPALAAGMLVISDRFMDASLAYQGYGRGLPLETLDRVNRFAISDRLPDLTLILMVPVEAGLEKAINTPKEGHQVGVGDRLEQAGLEFHRRVADGYRRLAATFPERIVLIDAVGTIAEVGARIDAALAARRGK